MSVEGQGSGFAQALAENRALQLGLVLDRPCKVEDTDTQVIWTGWLSSLDTSWWIIDWHSFRNASLGIGRVDGGWEWRGSMPL